MSVLLQLANVGQLYGNRVILKNIDCIFEAGTVTLLVGENGAGKSTLLQIMAGLLQPSVGTVQYTTDKIGYLGHQTFLYPELSALENLQFWTSLYGKKLTVDALLAALERVELGRFAYERAGTFSRGMAQRLNLARIFLQDPELLLLDEPGTGLDIRSTAILLHEISQARARGVAVVWISHSFMADAHVADRVLALHKHSLCYDGSAADFCWSEQVA